MLHHDGAAWSAVASVTTRDLYAIHGTAPDDIWAVGQGGTLLHRDRAGWHVLPAPANQDLFAVWAIGPGDVWASGYGIFHYDGVAWTRQAPDGTDLRAIWGPGPGDIWFVGDHHRLHWDGAAIGNPAGGPQHATGAWGTPPDNVWVVAYTAGSADGNLSQYLRTPSVNWFDDPYLGTPFAFHGITGTASGHLFIVGRGGSIMHHAP
jgi:hypothetical protein